jgi:8-oxo-dGTP pyrophosphatase MutT (NUDIX family)
MHTRVIESLKRHCPCDEKEAKDSAFIRNCLSKPGVWFGASNLEAHLTGSAFVLDSAGRVLFTHHRKLKRWLQLGGHSEVSERCLSETALREAQEESGLTDLQFHPMVEPRLLDVDVHLIPARAQLPAHHHLDLRYVFLTCMPEQIVVSSESRRLRWFTIGEALALEIDPALARALSKLPK